ncbi:RNA polymerase sigma-70 factor [Parapedobacter pyrenivorans]|uniref:RNA polymerase sigma-70 factor n=1 Tax=Parapedobacter pyrenivorans TaxID=1305674 RepID=UPI0033424827
MNLPSPPDSQLFLQELQAGDEGAFHTLFELYYPSLCLFAEKVLRDSVGAEDVVEDVFLNLWQAKPHFNTVDHLGSHLYLSVRNASLNVLKLRDRASKRQHHYLTSQPQYDEEHLAEITRQEGFRILYEAVRTLPEQAQKIIRLSYLEGKSNQEVADLLELSIHTVKAQKRRGVALLRDRLPGDLYFILQVSLSIFFKTV